MSNNESASVYIDIDDALKRVGGNKALYKKLLGRFTDGNYLEAIETALQSGDMEASAREAHTLKGVSANLSLEAVRALSVDLEAKIKAGEDYSGVLSDLQEAYVITKEKIAEVE